MNTVNIYNTQDEEILIDDDDYHKQGFRSAFLFILFNILFLSYTYSQCASGYTSGDLTITSTCTISSNITITGNLILNSGADLTIAPGVVVTVNGNVQTGWKVGTVSISGGTLNINTYLHNEDQTTLDITGTTISTGSYFLNDFKSEMTVTNSTVYVGSYLHNEDQSELEIDNSVFVVNDYVYNDFKANFELVNGSDMTVHGNTTLGGYAFHNENESEFVVDDSSLTINGNVYNDFKANLEIDNGGSMYVDGDFYNKNEAEIYIGDGSLHITGDFTNDFKAEVEIDNGGQMLVEGDVNSDSKSEIVVNSGGGFCTNGSMSDPDTINSSYGDTDCSDGCCGSAVTLPVELLSYVGVIEQNVVTLTWETATEINNEYFTIERSDDGILFYEVGRVAGSGDSDQEVEYSWSETVYTSGLVYYRLKQTDYDGQYEYLGMVSIASSGEKEISIFPNPVVCGQDITVTGISDGAQYVIRDLYQRVTAEGVLRYSNKIATGNLRAGYYLVTIISGNQTETKKLIVR